MPEHAAVGRTTRLVKLQAAAVEGEIDRWIRRKITPGMLMEHSGERTENGLKR